MKKEINTDQEFTRHLEEEEERFREKYPPARNFRVPSGYFERMSLSLSERIASEQKETAFTRLTKVIRKHNRLWIPVTTAVLIVVGLVILLPVVNAPRQVASTPADSSGSILDLDESYAHEAIVYEDARLNAEIEDSIQDVGLTLSQPSDSDSTITDADIIEYLSQQEIDPDLLAEL